MRCAEGPRCVSRRAACEWRAATRRVATLVALGISAAVAVAKPPPQARVDEIAALLDARPAGLGPMCADRRTWDALWQHPAERLRTEPLPEQPDELFLDFSRTGNRRPWERVASARRGRVKTLVVAECLEDRGRFVPALEQLVAVLCAEPTWVYPAHDPRLVNFRGERVDAWRWLRTYKVPIAQFRQPPGLLDRLPGVRTSVRGLLLAGDYTRHSSVQGAMESGRLAAEALLEGR